MWSSVTHYLQQSKKWTFCNYDDYNSKVGAFRIVGLLDESYQWVSLKHKMTRKDVSFYGEACLL